MTKNENAVFLDAMRYLDLYDDPPAGNGDGASGWWNKAAEDLVLFTNAHDEHPLAVQLGLALYSYIEIKANAKGVGSS